MSSHAVSRQNMVTSEKIISVLNKYYEVQESTDTNESVEKEMSMLDDKVQNSLLLTTRTTNIPIIFSIHQKITQQNQNILMNIIQRP